MFYNQTKAAQERMEEMRQLIGMRQSDNVRRPRSAAASSPSGPGISNSVQVDAFTRSLEDMLSDADRGLEQALTSHDTLQIDLSQLTSDLKEVSLATSG